MQKDCVDSDLKSWGIKWFNMGAKDRFGYPEYSLLMDTMGDTIMGIIWNRGFIEDLWILKGL